MATASDLKRYLDKPGLTYFWSKIKTYVDEADDKALASRTSEPVKGKIDGWVIGDVSSGKDISALVNMKVDGKDVLMNIGVTDGKVTSSAQSGNLDGATLDVGIGEDGKLYVFSDTAMPGDSVITVIAVSDPGGELLHEPTAIKSGKVPEMVEETEVEWSTEGRVDEIESLIPETASEFNPLIDKTTLDTEMLRVDAVESVIPKAATLSNMLVTAADLGTESERIDTLAAVVPMAATAANPLVTQDVLEAESARVDSIETMIPAAATAENPLVTQDVLEAESVRVDTIEQVIPTTATSSNPLATKDTVDAAAARVDTIESVIPESVTVENPLVDKAYADSIKGSMTIHFLGSAADGSPFQYYEDLFPEEGTPDFYYGGAKVVPTNNDITIVSQDTRHGQPTPASPATSRYRFDGNTWVFEYIIGSTSFSPSQMAAIDSGITSDLRVSYSAHVADTSVHMTAGEKVELLATIASLTEQVETLNNRGLKVEGGILKFM